MKTVFGLIVVIISLLSACTMEDSDAPEPDFDLVRTQAVQTAVMQVTADAVLHPNTTPSPQPAIFQEEPSASQPGPGKTTEHEDTGSNDPAMVNPDSIAYACEVENRPSSSTDGPKRAGESYVEVWRIRNTGSATWRSNQVAAMWVGGEHLCTRDSIALGWSVAPGDAVEIRVPIHVPDNPSETTHMMAWALVNGEGNIFCKFYHSINLVK